MRMLSIVQWHHFAYMIISVALLGYGASGTFIALFRTQLQRRFAVAFATCALLFSVAMLACFGAVQRVPFNALEVVWDPRQFVGLGLIYLACFVPFFFAACCIGLAFTCRRDQISRLYFFDLFGAGLGAALIIGVLFALTLQNALLVLVGIALVASAVVGLGRAARRRFLPAYLAWTLFILVGIPDSWLDLSMSEYKGLSQALQVVDARVVKVSSSPLGQLTVVSSPTIRFREAAGLSFATRYVPPEQLGVFTDGDGLSPITRFDGDFDGLGYLGDMTASLPYKLLDEPDVLVLGAGGGADVLLALFNGASHVDAVELNPHMSALVQEAYADFAGHLYDDPRVTLHTAEARGFVVQTTARYDLIHIGLLDSFGASGTGVQSLHESYLYTTEGLEKYLARLSPDGLLAITRWLRLPPRDSIKLLATAIDALRRSGADDPGRRLAMIRSWNTTTLVVKNGELTPVDVDAIREFATSRSFDTVVYPGIRPIAANRYNVLDEPYFHDAAMALLGESADEFFKRYKFRVAAATDDRPYFFNFFKWRSFREVLALRKRGGAGLIDWGYLILVSTLIQALVSGALLIVLPLACVKRNWPRGTGFRMGGYFFLLGLAFLFIEIAFIQKFILFLSHPLYAVAVILAGFLVFAGIGSACSERLTAQSPVTIVVTGMALISLLYAALLPVVFERFIGHAEFVRIGLSLFLIAPLAFLMGMPFPLGLNSLSRHAPGFIPWAWGINGFASVVSTSLATLLAIEFGFTAVLLLALLLYACAAMLLHGQRRLPTGARG